MVFIVHFGQQMDFRGFIRDFTNFGAQGVDLFFLISGFLAGKTFLDNANINVKKYYIKRAIAILPLYYSVIFYYFISENLLNQISSVIPPDNLGIGWFRYIFLLNGFLNSDTSFWSNLGMTWTIPIFMFFYLIAPWILRKVRTVFSSVVVWLVVCIITKVCTNFYECSILSNIHILFLGVVIYACTKSAYNAHAIVFFSAVAICMSILENQTYTHISVFACIILALTAIDNICFPDWLQRIINILDKYSYTLYLAHGIIFCSVIKVLRLVETSETIIAITAIFGTIIATWLVGKYIEKPIQKLLKKHLIK